MKPIFNVFTNNFDFVESNSSSQSTTVTIPASSTLVVDSFAKAEAYCFEYSICLSKGTSFLPKTLKLKVWKSDTDVNDHVYSRNSAVVRANISSSLTATDYNLTVVNNETVDIEINFIKQTL